MGREQLRTRAAGNGHGTPSQSSRWGESNLAELGASCGSSAKAGHVRDQGLKVTEESLARVDEGLANNPPKTPAETEV